MAHTNSVKHVYPKCVRFCLYHPDEIRRMSVVKVCVPILFNALGLPMKGGLYDPAMGPFGERGDVCATCKRLFLACPGHFGHIELPLPVYNSFFLKTVYTILHLSCLECHQLKVPGHLRYLLIAQLQLLDAGFVVEAQELAGQLSELSSTDPDTLSGAAHAVLSKEAVTEYLAKILSNSEPKVLFDKNSKNVEVLRAQCLALAKEYLRPQKRCLVCKRPMPKMSLMHNKIMTVSLPQDEETGGRVIAHPEPIFVTPEEARKHLRALWVDCSDFIMALAPVLHDIKSEYPTDMFFVETVPVPPPKVRPVNFIRNTMMEHPQTTVLQQVLEHSIVARNIAHIVQGGTIDELPQEAREVYDTMAGQTPIEKLHHTWQGLQGAVDNLVDAELNNTVKLGKTASAGLKQVISKKEGLIRMHMMGKRVNFAGRTVITPDPNLGVDEIGIPEAFAMVLTYPTPVTPWNVDDLRKAVLNGPNVYPGATMVQNERGQMTRVSAVESTQRASLAKRLLTPAGEGGEGAADGAGVAGRPKIVHRHLRSGDALLLNRQPTLHRPSIMAHRARVLRGERTLRMHYANCKAYNADFDGDEMNAHFPQNELARAEAYLLAQVGQQYLVPKDGTPLSGLIQDHVVGGVRLTLRGRFLSRADYCALLQQAMPALGARARLLPPAMLRPRRLWSGKQLVSTVLLNCVPAGRPPPTLRDHAKIPARAWGAEGRPWRAGGAPPAGDALSEAEVVLREGELLCGVLDKKHFGSTPFGLAHCVYELYGGETCARLLSALGRLFTAFLQREGFTLGVRDILVVEEADARRRRLLRKAHRAGPAAVAAAFGLPPPSPGRSEEELPEVAAVKMGRIATGDLELRATLDHAYKSALDPATNAVSRTCLHSGLLEAFPANNLQLMVQSGAKGSTVNTLQISCLLGQIELEGRRPPLMPSGKALPSFRRFETAPRAGGFVAGRFLTGIKPQEFFFHCMAGREGLIDTAVKTSRSGYLQRCLVKHLEGLVIGYDGTVRDSDGSLVQLAYGEDGLDILRSQFLTSKQLPVLADNYKAFFNKEEFEMLQPECDDQDVITAKKEVRRWKRKMRRHSGSVRPLRVSGSFTRTPDPVSSRVPPSAALAGVTEKLEDLIDSYLKERGAVAESMHAALLLKGVHARADAGEPVGVLAAQSIGEPSTQMTLNTFHFAGRGEMNVTLGIPRLREVLMMASRNPKTPSMEVPIRSDIVNATSTADDVCRRLRRTCFAELLECVNVTENLEISQNNRSRVYQFHMRFLPTKELNMDHSVTPHQALRHVETKFLAQLLQGVRRNLQISSVLLDADASRGKERKARENDVEEDRAGDRTERGTLRENLSHIEEEQESSDEDSIGDDEDATFARRRAQHNETHEYESAEEEEVELTYIGEGDDEHDSNTKESDLSHQEEPSAREERQQEKRKGYKERVEEVLRRHKFVTSYKYDEKCELWCDVSLSLPLSFGRVDFSNLLKDIAEQSVVSETPGIRKAFVNTDTNGIVTVRTAGSNLSALFPYEDVLDLNRIYSNDVHVMSQTYGIEAARAVLVKEVRDVFKVYGITVDPRHLLLVADYMTFLGSYEPLSKRGMETGCSPLQQMSFEASLSFLQNAALRGRHDALQSPSSCIMLGRPCAAGTGAFSLRQQLAVSV